VSDLPSHPEGRDRFAELLGVDLELEGDGDARGRIPVSERLRQPYGNVHGGVYSVLAETVCSWATDAAVRGDGMAALGQALEISFLRPIRAGHVTAAAHARHRGSTTWVWDVEITDDDDRLCALARMTVAVRPAREGG
jgi:1,4-dihydroxy-2-naphthoyl-CoA hydrolase